MKNIDKNVNFWGLPLVSSSRHVVLNEVTDWINNSSKLAYIFTPNPEQVIQAKSQDSFKGTLQQARWLLPDGVGLLWATQLVSLIDGSPALTTTLPGREIVSQLIQLAKSHKWKIVLLGGRDYNHRIPADWPIIWLEGYQDSQHPTREEETHIITALKKHRPSIVMVALGAPRQETWLVDHQAVLEQANVKIGMAVGGSFDTLLGVLQPAPSWMSRSGLEWLFRLVQQPWRWRRQTRLLEFIVLTLGEMIRAVGRLAKAARA